MVERTTSDPIVGRLLDRRYEVGPRVARGGMATVYEARDLRLDRTVAVKVMHGDLGDDHDFAARFVREARAAARLSHPNVVSVFDQGDDDGTLFLAMEYVPGHTLRDLLRQEAPVSPTRALALLEPILSALAAAHAAGLVHRDVKPENVLIADDGRVKVADFGLARAVSAETQHTATGGVLIGTVSYLAPELVVDGVADARADVYAVGVLLYELLTGTKPHDGDSPIQIAYKHVHEDVPPPSAKVPGIPPYVDALVARATARDRAQRPADAQVLLHHVHRVRHALDAGLRDDPELTADLAPRVLPTGREDTSDLSLDDDDRQHTAVVPLQRPPVDPADAAAARARPRGRGHRRRGVVIALVLVLLALASTAGWWFGFARYTTTPGVINLSVAAAEERVEEAGLRLDVGDEEFSETVTAGSVIRTDPTAGSRILEDGTVTAVVSLGPERYEVPDLRGESEADAVKALEERSLEPGDVLRRYHERVADGAVIRTAPAAGTELRRGTPVDLVVSRGRRPIDVPDVTGREAGQAESELDDLGLSVDIDRAFDEDVPEGRVISQNPSSGTLFRGDTVQLVVSRGAELIEVPRVRGIGVEEATRRLEDAGFKVKTKRSDLYVGLEYVVGSDPRQGTEAKRGSTVTLSLV
ncbi:MAG: Stk1 family PASTA domain-containing Ser/Thr kinase [Nocardioides sp.]|nr:Stk1 family PASTA domain-containing Ser/Thr kinase [Nocardioides sp.]